MDIKRNDSFKEDNSINIRGARQHNLKNIDLSLPRNKFKVYKNVIDGTPYTSISKLTTKKQRKHELIELIGGYSSEVNEYASRLLDCPAA